MKKIITKFWGVALIVMLLSTLFVAATPVSAADPLAWNTESIPGTSGNVLLPASDIKDFSIGNDSATIYAGTGTDDVYKSTNAGLTWGPIDTSHNVDLVAVASDSTDVAVTVDTATENIRLTLDGGSTWSDFETATLTTGVTAAIVDIDLSQVVNNVRYCAIATTNGDVWTRKFGNAWDEWVQADSAYAGYVGTTQVHAISFSPNFPGDRSLVAVTENGSGLRLETLVFSATPLWNGETNYPASILDYAGAEITNATDACLALSPDYSGAGEVESVAFVGVTSGGTSAGIYRMDDYISSNLKRSVDIYSIAFDGSVAVAGTTAAVVWRSENPLDSSPTFAGNSNMKGPDGTTNAIVAFVGSSVVAGTSGDASGFSVSTDNGRSFAGISLMDTTIINISDMQVSADGSIVYLLISDNVSATDEVSLFRYNGAWQRVLVDTTATNDWIVRINPASPNSIYVTDLGGATMYYSAAGGDTRWFSRSSPGVVDLAVESDSVVYAAVGATVMKSTNAGRFFNDAVATRMTSVAINSMTLISENNLLVVSTDGYVSYSTDGNTSWTTISTDLGTGSQVTADGLVAGSHIYANDGATVKMWTIGQLVTDGWKSVSIPGVFGPATTVTGFGFANGYLYANTATNFSRNNLAWLPEVGPFIWSSSAAGAGTWDNAPSALRLSTASTYVKVWEASATTLYSYMDPLVFTKPTAIAPVEGALIPLNTQTNTPYNITFSWTRPSLATAFNLFLCFDPFLSMSAVGGPIEVPGGLTATQSYTLTTAQLAGLTPGTTYYWSVTVKTPLSSGFSAMPGMSFTIESSPASVPTIGSPVNGGSIMAGTSAAFSWSPVTGTTVYVFELSESPDFTNIMYTYNAPNAGVLLPGSVKLTAGKVYFWRVKALSPVESAWSTIANFTVEEAQATTTAPAVTTTLAPSTTVVTTFTIPPTEKTEVNPGYIWAIIIIGAVLVIAVIVLIVRTRRSV